MERKFIENSLLDLYDELPEELQNQLLRELSVMKKKYFNVKDSAAKVMASLEHEAPNKKQIIIAQLNAVIKYSIQRSNDDFSQTIDERIFNAEINTTFEHTKKLWLAPVKRLSDLDILSTKFGKFKDNLNFILLQDENQAFYENMLKILDEMKDISDRNVQIDRITLKKLKYPKCVDTTKIHKLRIALFCEYITCRSSCSIKNCPIKYMETLRYIEQKLTKMFEKEANKEMEKKHSINIPQP